MKRSVILILTGSAATAIVILVLAASPIAPSAHTPEHLHNCSGFVVMHHHDALRTHHSNDYPWYRQEWSTEDVRRLLDDTRPTTPSGDVEAPLLAQVRAMPIEEAKATLNAAYAACMDHAWPEWLEQEKADDETP